jgi:hypothetical protein
MNPISFARHKDQVSRRDFRRNELQMTHENLINGTFQAFGVGKILSFQPLEDTTGGNAESIQGVTSYFDCLESF